MTQLFSRVVLAMAVLGSAMAHAQGTAGYGDWQLHLPTTHPLRLADAGDRLYVVTENAFYFLDKILNTTQTLSSRDGLHDVGAAVVAYDSVKRQTVVVYRNNNIDVIQANGTVRNVSDVLRKSISGTRQVNDLMLAGRRGYICTSFGVVVLDLDKLEVSDTYTSIGPGGATVDVYSAALTHDSLFVTTSQGVEYGRLSSNLLDYRSWTRPAALPGTCRQLAVYANHIYAGVQGGDIHVFQPTRNHWQVLYGGYASNVNRLKANKVGLLVSRDAYGVERVTTAPPFAAVVAPAATGDNVQDFVRNADGSFYVANYVAGLQYVGASGTTRDTYKANGPQTAQAYGILADARSNTVDVFTGGYSSGYVSSGNKSGFYEYKAGQWTNFTKQEFPDLNDFPNLADQVRGARAADGTLYVATFKDGLLRWNGRGDFEQFTANAGFHLRDMVPGYYQVPDVAVAPDGKVWAINYHKQTATSGLFSYDPVAKTWAEYPLFPGTEALERIVIDNLGQVWVTGSGKGLGANTVVDPNGTNGTTPFQTNTGSEEIRDITKDQRGDIWVATGKGVAVLNDPGGVFGGSSKFRTPIVRRGDGTGFPALFSDVVKCLAVDGGNRKWFGTDNGIWLFSEDADEALLHFTTANSPLPSNHIQDVDVNNRTGEVWIATDAGVVSYRGSASLTDGSPDCTKVFPNPVRPDFTGTMGITGVVNNAQVKITDVAGHLVYAAKASGGTVTWNLNDVDGQRVKSGVYLVLTADADGKNGCVSKVAVLSK